VYVYAHLTNVCVYAHLTNIFVYAHLNQMCVFIRISDLQKLRQQVMSEIRANQQLDGELNQMDIKIGLLVKNRITLQVTTIYLQRRSRDIE